MKMEKIKRLFLAINYEEIQKGVMYSVIGGLVAGMTVAYSMGQKTPEASVLEVGLLLFFLLIIALSFIILSNFVWNILKKN